MTTYGKMMADASLRKTMESVLDDYRRSVLDEVVSIIIGGSISDVDRALTEEERIEIEGAINQRIACDT